MILLKDKIKKIKGATAEAVKINCIYEAYSDIALFWEQDDQKAIISMLDGNMVIFNRNADCDELKQFINVVSPLSVFSDVDTLTKLFGKNFHKVCVMQCNKNFVSNQISDKISSDEIYKLLDVNGLNLPQFEHFAVDFCHRLNCGQLKYFCLKDECAAVTISDGQAVLLNGIASHKKGRGTVALKGVLSQRKPPYIAVCEEAVKPFYLKNNFKHIYDVGYWRKDA